MKTWQIIRASTLRRHVHTHAYAALVLSGGYEEAGDLGRFQVEAGDVVFHERFEAHLDRFYLSGARILNLPLPTSCAFHLGPMRVNDPDQIVRIAEKSKPAAAALLVSLAEPRIQAVTDWPDELATVLLRNPSVRLGPWSRMKGIAPWTVSRAFIQIFDISPSSFRARVRARRAWKAICTTTKPLVEIATELGFSDQAHMTRSVKNLTGYGPHLWRSAN
jgi:AraC-like DNA-binding protein